MTTPWASMGTLSQYMDVSPSLGFFESIVSSTVLTYWNESYFDGPKYLVYFADITALIMNLAGAGYVIVKTVDAGVSAANAFYATYGGQSTFGNRLYLYEVIFIILNEMWSLVVTILGLYTASQVWELLEARLSEAAASSIGVDTALTYEKAIKQTTLLFVMGLGVGITAYALGEVASPLVTFFDEYQNDTPNEGQDKTTGDYDVDGTAAQEDLIAHMITAFYGFFVLSAISIGGYIYMFNFLGFDDTFECDLQEGVISAATYSGIPPILSAMTDRKSCEETIEGVFKIFDLNKDGAISRCEDATFQHALGSDKAYALKFSEAFTLASFKKICTKRFPTFPGGDSGLSA